MNQTEISRRPWIVPLLLVLAVLATFWRVGQCEFINYDDPDYVTANPYVQAGLTTPGMVWAFGNTHGVATYWHPLTWLSHMFDCQLFGVKAGPHHWMNLFFHTLNVLLLFLVLKRMTGALWPSAVAAALWAVHPLQVDTVAWVTERKNLLSALFWILTMGAYVRYAARPGLGRYLLVVVGMVLGLMCKPILVALPCALLLLDFWPLRRFPFSRASQGASSPFPVVLSGRLLAEKIPLFVLALVSAFVTLMAHKQIGNLAHLPLSFRIENAVVSCARYLGKTLWPVNLAVFYPLPDQWSGWQVALSAGLLLAVTGLALWQARRAPYLLVGWLWFLCVLAPASGVVQQAGLQAMADRFAYLPLIGLFFMISWSGFSVLNRLRLDSPWFHLPALLAVIAGSMVSSVQVRHWRNTQTLFGHAAEVTKDNYVAYAVLGDLAATAGRLDQATQFFKRSLEIKPAYHEAHFAFANTLSAQGQDTEALLHFQEAVRLDPRNAEARTGLGALLVRNSNATVALNELNEALRINPNLVPARLNLATALQMLGRTDEAAATYARAAGLPPGTAAAYLGFGNFLISQRRFAEAIPCYRQTLKFDPNSVDALSRLAWVYATHQDAAVRNGAEAVRLATQACALTKQQDALSMNTLAAAYAETGQFPKAVETAQKALDLAKRSGPTQIATIVQNLLESYQAGKPYRE